MVRLIFILAILRFPTHPAEIEAKEYLRQTVAVSEPENTTLTNYKRNNQK